MNVRRLTRGHARHSLVRMQLKAFVSPAFGQNAYIAWKEGSTSAVAIDPGGVASEMADTLAENGLWLEAILLTHAHLDHIEGVATLVARTGAPIYLHPADRLLYDNVQRQAEKFGLQVEEQPPIDHELADGDKLQLAGLDLEVIHLPGHSPGHVIFVLPKEGAAFVGDVVFHGSIGRTDLPGGNMADLINGIREHVLTLPDETALYSGHGPPTTVGRERTTNPFLIPHFGGGLA